MAIVTDIRNSMVGPTNIPADAIDAQGYPLLQDQVRLRNSFGNGASQIRWPSRSAAVQLMSGHNPYFLANWQTNIPWPLIYALSGHASQNTAVVLRNIFMQVFRADNVWEMTLSGCSVRGKRVLHGNDSSPIGINTQTELSGGVLRVKPSSGEGYEVWPNNWSGGANVYGATMIDSVGTLRPDLFQSDFKGFATGLEVGLTKIDPNGPDDAHLSRFCVQIGHDPTVHPFVTSRYITDAGVHCNSYGCGYPYSRADGGFSKWSMIDWEGFRWVGYSPVSDWAMVRGSLPPPWGDFSSPHPYNIPPYTLTESQILANPPLDPPEYSGSTPLPPTPAPAPGPAPAVAGPPVNVQPAIWTTRTLSNHYYIDTTPAPAPEPPPAPAPTPVPAFYALAPGYSPITVMGTGVPGATLSLLVDAVLEDTETVDQYGEWAIAVLREPGTYSLTATQTVEGQTSSAAGPVTMLVHAFAPGPDGGGGTGRRRLHGAPEWEQQPKAPAPPKPSAAPMLLRPFKSPKRWPSDG